jgi:hypothetical protein
VSNRRQLYHADTTVAGAGLVRSSAGEGSVGGGGGDVAAASRPTMLNIESAQERQHLSGGFGSLEWEDLASLSLGGDR